MAYTMYLGGMQLPVTPEKLEVKIQNQNSTLTLINEGEVNILKKAGLTEIAFEMLIPQVKYPFSDYPNGFQGAPAYLDKLEELKTSKTPFQFICSRVSPAKKNFFHTNMTVAMEDYTITEDASKLGFDLMVKIKLKQYRHFGTKTVVVSNPSNQTPVAEVATNRPAAAAPLQKTYTVVSGDCLWNIAKRYLGDGSRYPEIYNLNKDKIVNPNLIYPGQVLVLPA